MALNPNDANSIKQNYSGYSSWNDPASIVADFKATGGQGKGGPTSSSGGNTSALDPTQTFNNALDQSKQIRQFNIDSAQPQISTLQGNKSNLDTQYQTLLDSIKGDQTLAVNNATKATNATMAARGLSTQDPMAQTNLAGAQSAAAQPYSSLQAQTGVQKIQDENSIAAQIAALQAGNPEQAVSASTGIGALAAQLGQVGVQQQSAGYIPIPGYGVYDTKSGQIIGGLNGLNSTGQNTNGLLTYNP